MTERQGKKRRLRLRSEVIIGLYVLVMVICAVVFTKYVDQEALRATVDRTGPYGMIAFFLIEVVYVTFTPLFNTFILIAAGYFFGGPAGFVINFFATALGLFAIIFLVRRYGRKQLQRIISPRYYRRFDDIVEKVGPMSLLVLYVLPFTPDDELTYIVAAGSVSFKRFILPIVLGTLAKAAYSYIGALGAQGIAIATLARVILLGVGIVAVGTQEYLMKRYAAKDQ